MNTAQSQISKAVDTLKEDLVAFIQKMVRIPSLPGQERAVQKVVAAKLESLGMKVASHDVDPQRLQNHPAFCDDGFPYDNRVNVIGVMKGRESAASRSLILNGHMDVVSPGDENQWSHSPWAGVTDGRRIFGRGAADMKSGLAAGIFALEALINAGIHLNGDLQIQSVAGEETGGCGTLAGIIDGYTGDAAVILEPTRLTLCPVQSGALSFRLTVRGRSVHACLKNKGVSAIEKFITLFQAIETFDAERHREYDNPLYPDAMNIAPTSIGVVKSGDWPSTIPDALIADGRYGVFPDESVRDAKQRFVQMIMQAAEGDEWLRQNPPTIEWREGQFEPGSTRLDSPIIDTLSECHQAVTQKKPGLEGVTYGSDLRLFTNYGNIPTVLYGPGDVLDAHTIDESIDISEILVATKILALSIVKWCGKTSS